MVRNIYRKCVRLADTGVNRIVKRSDIHFLREIPIVVVEKEESLVERDQLFGCGGLQTACAVD